MYNLFVNEFGFTEDGSYEGNPKYVKDDFVLVQMEGGIIPIERICKDFEPEVYIVASTHRSEKAYPTLSTHSPGNWADAGLGGEERVLSVNPACYVKKALQSLEKVEGFDRVLEVTHHGPSVMNAPILYVEVGSSEKEWQNLDACRSVCKAIMSLDDVEECETVVGFGGMHYSECFTKIMLETEYAVGHICPKYYLDKLDEEMVLQAFEKTIPRPKLALIEWKSFNSEQRQKLISILDKNGIEWKRRKELV